VLLYTSLTAERPAGTGAQFRATLNESRKGSGAANGKNALVGDGDASREDRSRLDRLAPQRRLCAVGRFTIYSRMRSVRGRGVDHALLGRPAERAVWSSKAPGPAGGITDDAIRQSRRNGGGCTESDQGDARTQILGAGACKKCSFPTGSRAGGCSKGIMADCSALRFKRALTGLLSLEQRMRSDQHRRRRVWSARIWATRAKALLWVGAFAGVPASACGSNPTSPSPSSLSVGQWNGTTAQGRAITFTVSSDEMLTTSSGTPSMAVRERKPFRTCRSLRPRMSPAFLDLAQARRPPIER
jgi:hypothetical protein